MRAALIGAAGILTAAAWVLYARESSAAVRSVVDGVGQVENALEAALYGITEGVGMSGWTESKIPAEYLGAIRTAEAANGIPHNMLARLLWQESRYRQDIISGATRSPAGAIGIAQFMPATAAEWGVNPLDPVSSIAGAGRYLKWLHGRLGSWDKALAAYNWGIGNVQRKGLAVAPRETRNYYTQILADIGMGVYA